MNLHRLQELQDLLYEYRDVIQELGTDSVSAIENTMIVVSSEPVYRLKIPAFRKPVFPDCGLPMQTRRDLKSMMQECIEELDKVKVNYVYAPYAPPIPKRHDH